MCPEWHEEMESIARPRASLATVAKTDSTGVTVDIIGAALTILETALPAGENAEVEAKRQKIPTA